MTTSRSFFSDEQIELVTEVLKPNHSGQRKAARSWGDRRRFPR